ncbi:MAG: SIS domain-containing protein [Desulfurococcaceae archaeon]
MIDAYLNWPKQIRDAIETWGKYFVEGSFNEIVVVGMGGSGIVGDYLQILHSASGGIPVYTIKSHVLPRFIDENTLILIISYSGNTVETLAALKQALNTKGRIVTVSSGGYLRDESSKLGLTHISIPSGLPPRASLPSMLYSILGLLDSSGYGVYSREDASRSLLFLEASIKKAKSIAEDVSKWLYKHVVSDERLFIIATHSPLEPLAVRGKNEFNENSKLIAKVDVAPEWMHNDIVGYEHPVPRKFCVLEIVDPSDAIGNKLVDFMEKIYLQYDTKLYKFTLDGNNTLEKLMYGSLILGLSSSMLAEIRGLNPVETKNITLYKHEASKIFTL